MQYNTVYMQLYEAHYYKYLYSTFSSGAPTLRSSAQASDQLSLSVHFKFESVRWLTAL